MRSLTSLRPLRSGLYAYISYFHHAAGVVHFEAHFKYVVVTNETVCAHLQVARFTIRDRGAVEKPPRAGLYRPSRPRDRMPDSSKRPFSTAPQSPVSVCSRACLAQGLSMAKRFGAGIVGVVRASRCQPTVDCTGGATRLRPAFGECVRVVSIIDSPPRL